MQPLLQWKNSKCHICWGCGCSLGYPGCHGMGHIVICGLSGSTKCFHFFSRKAWVSKKKFEHKIRIFVFFPLQSFPETFLILIIFQGYSIINVYWSSCKTPSILVTFQWNLKFLDNISKNIHIPNFMKILPVGSQLFHADGQMDRYDETNSCFSQFCESV